MASHHTTTRPPANPLILILGATGTGKSNLAIQISQAFNNPSQTKPSLPLSRFYAGAEIINADAMQLYCGLPVITNKVTTAEQSGIPHHLLNHIDLEAEPWTVQRYVQEADMIIQSVRQRGHIPIVVGGTSYYVHGLLFRDALIEVPKQSQNQLTEEYEHGEESMVEQDVACGKDTTLEWPILAADTAEIYAKLLEVDPEMAKRWHPNDRRKIQRSLEIYLRSGKTASEFYDEQKRRNSATILQNSASESYTNGYLRYDPIIFWLAAEDKVLKDRLSRRVDAMVDNGLLAEAEEMDQVLQQAHRNMAPLDKSKGIWVSIGYKEMEPWVEACRTGVMKEEDLNKLKSTCIEAVKAGTRQYAKRQNRYIRLRFTNALANAKATQNLFLLDCTDLQRWEENALNPALGILESFLQGERLPEPSSLSQLADQIFTTMVPGERVARVARKCETCGTVLMTEAEWTQHLISRSHKKVLQKGRKREFNEAMKGVTRSAREIKSALDDVDLCLAAHVHDR